MDVLAGYGSGDGENEDSNAPEKEDVDEGKFAAEWAAFENEIAGNVDESKTKRESHEKKVKKKSKKKVVEASSSSSSSSDEEDDDEEEEESSSEDSSSSDSSSSSSSEDERQKRKERRLRRKKADLKKKKEALKKEHAKEEDLEDEQPVKKKKAEATDVGKRRQSEGEAKGLDSVTAAMETAQRLEKGGHVHPEGGVPPPADKHSHERERRRRRRHRSRSRSRDRHRHRPHDHRRPSRSERSHHDRRGHHGNHSHHHRSHDERRHRRERPDRNHRELEGGGGRDRGDEQRWRRRGEERPRQHDRPNFKDKMRQDMLSMSKRHDGGERNDIRDTERHRGGCCLDEKHMNTQQQLMQTMAEMHRKAQEETGVSVPKFYNPAVVNPLKYAEQMQKRKLLWSKNKDKDQKDDTASTQIWKGTSFQDEDGKQTAKFRKLMGIKDEEGEGQGNVTDVARKQTELFEQLDREYALARMATHTHRGVGLGFGGVSMSAANPAAHVTQVTEQQPQNPR